MGFLDRFSNHRMERYAQRYYERTGEQPASLNAMYHITEAGKDYIDKRYDVTAKGRILMALFDEGQMTGRELATHAKLNYTQTQIVLTKLERWGLTSSTGNEPSTIHPGPAEPFLDIPGE